MTDTKDAITKLLDKAVAASDSSDAMRFAQAAINAAHAVNVQRSLPPLPISPEKANA